MAGLGGETGSSLALSNVVGADAGITQSCQRGVRSAMTNSASLTVNENVVVAIAPVSVTNCPAPAPVSVVGATGTGLNFQWYKGGNALPGRQAAAWCWPM